MYLTRVVASDLRPVDINDLALNTTIYYTSDLSNIALDFGLSSALFGTYHIDRDHSTVRAHQITGILTLLVIVAVIFLRCDFPLSRAACLHTTLFAHEVGRDSTLGR